MRLLAVLFLSAGLVSAQYVGTYTIRPDGSGDFVSFKEAADSLSQYGIAGNCFFEAYTGTYTGRAYLNNINTGAFTITFRPAAGQDVRINAKADYAFEVYRTNAVKIEGLRMRSNVVAVYLREADRCRVSRCRITAPSGVLVYWYSDYDSIIGNEMRCTSPYGIRVDGYNLLRSAGIVIANNTIAGWTSAGIYLSYHDDSRLYYNTVYTASATTNCVRDEYGYRTIARNNIYFQTNSATDAVCYYKRYGDPLSSDYNCFWKPAGGNVGYYDGLKTWADWRAMGLDGNGINQNPVIVTANLHLRPSSPCIGAATPIAGITTDVDGNARDPVQPDIGADEWTPLLPPMAGVYTIKQDGSGDYQSVYDATSDLLMRGTAGDVVFDIYQGTYFDNIWLEDVNNGANYVTYQAHVQGIRVDTVTLDVYGSTYAVWMRDVSRFRFRNLGIMGFTGSTGYGFYLAGPVSPYKGCDSCVIAGCRIDGPNGIYLNLGCDDDSILGNSIFCSSSYGIVVWGVNTTTLCRRNVIANNMVWGWTSFGVYLRFHQYTQFCYNTVHGNRSSSCCVYDYYGYDAQLRNNVLATFYGGDDALGYYRYQGGILQSDYNCFYCPQNPSGYVARVYPGNYMTWSQWQAAGYDGHGVNQNPKFGGPPNLHLQTGSPCIGGASPIAGLVTDIDGDARDPVTPDIGADEWVDSGLLPMSGVYTIKQDGSGDYLDFRSALADLRLRGFGGGVQFDVYSGTYAGMVDLEGIGNDTFRLTLRAFPGENVTVRADTLYGFQLWGGSQRIRIEGFNISGFTSYGVYMTNSGLAGCDSCAISGNTIFGPNGIYIGSYCDYDTFAGNTIRCVSSYGVYINGSSSDPNSHLVFCNNMVSGFSTYGFYFLYVDSSEMVFNSMSGPATYGYYARSCYEMTQKNNALYAQSYAYYVYLGDLFPKVSDHNCFYSSQSYCIGHSFYGNLTLAQWKALSGRDSVSISAAPGFVSPTDLHLTAGSPCIHAGTPYAGITTDIDGNPRHPIAPDIGADETSFPSDRDASVVRINAPVSVVGHYATVTPSVDLTNFGSQSVIVSVTFIIEPETDAGNESDAVTASALGIEDEPNLMDQPVYDTTEYGVLLAPGDTATFAFTKTWVADPAGHYLTTAYVYSPFDLNHSNDTLTGNFTVATEDVGVQAILAPTGRVDTSVAISPRARVENFSLVPMSFTAWFVIWDSTDAQVYRDSVEVLDLSPATDSVLEFPEWPGTRVEGTHTTLCSLAISDDNPDNDTLWSSFTVQPRPPWEAGWREAREMPSYNSGLPAKQGAWLAYNEADGLVYAAKGGKTDDFYAYDAVPDSWCVLAAVPKGNEGKLPDKGACGVADGAERVYMVKGGNTLGFWRYAIEADSWRQIADVPLGPNRKKVKGGSDVVYVPPLGPDSVGSVYLLKGYNTEFWRYDPEAGVWDALSDAPTGSRPKWDKGSFLAYDGDRTIYAHKAKYHELWAYDVLDDSWGSAPLTGMPLVGASGRRKKSKDGGCGAWYDGCIYALKGGNTCEFWRYTAAADSWNELDTMPAVGSTGKKKRVKAGGDIVSYGLGVFFALKGNKTRELWRFVLPEYDLGPSRDGVMAQRIEPGRLGITIGPNPVAGRFAQLRYSLPEPGLLAIRLVDVAGRLAGKRGLPVARAGVLSLDLRSLSAGVYFVTVEAPGITVRRKLVLQ